jgi:hypothetical protein
VHQFSEELVVSRFISKSHGAAMFCALATLLASACAGGGHVDAPIQLSGGLAVPIDEALPHLPAFVGQRIIVAGLPRQREGRCSGVQPLTRKDWMLVGEAGGCLWVSGESEHARLLDLRSGLGKYAVTVSGLLLRTEQGIYVLRLDP